MNWHSWRTHFEANAARPLPAVEAEGLTWSEKKIVSASLARFQLGESGEGRIANDIDRANLPGIDTDYRAALKLFVKEEGRHGRVLGLMVRGLGGRLLEKQWTEKLFVVARRALGIRFKLLVLLAAEVIAIGVYSHLARALKGPIARAFAQICEDEEAHLRFHAAFFQAQAASPMVWRVLRLAWWPLAIAASVAVLVDHRKLFDVLKIGPWEVAKAFWEQIAKASRGMKPNPAPTREPSLESEATP